MVHTPYQRFSAAACGDAGALRRLVDDCAATARREGDWSALVEAMLLARLAYGLTMLREDGLRLMELLELAVSVTHRGSDAELQRVLSVERGQLRWLLDPVEAG